MTTDFDLYELEDELQNAQDFLYAVACEAVMLIDCQAHPTKAMLLVRDALAEATMDVKNAVENLNGAVADYDRG